MDEAARRLCHHTKNTVDFAKGDAGGVAARQSSFFARHEPNSPKHSARRGTPASQTMVVKGRSGRKNSAIAPTDRFGRVLRPRRTIVAGFDAAHDRDSCS